MNTLFEILIKEDFVNINENDNISIVANKNLLSLINDFENGQWRYERFQNYIWDNIAETALSTNEKENLIDNSYSKLVQSAKNLRLTNNDVIGAGSELCEILLYGIMKDHYSALPVVPKIFYKQNSQDNAKGADSVHIVIENDNSDFSLWFGEAKFYKNIDGAINDAITSINNFFSENGKQIRKENSIITSISDIKNFGLQDSLVEKIKEFLDFDNSLDNIKPKINIPILLLHECNITKSNTRLTQAYKDKIIDFHKDKANKYFKNQFEKLSFISQYEDINFHLILFPIPDKKQIVDKFLSNAVHYRN